MTVRPVYQVVVTREADVWLADVPTLEGAHTYSRTLSALDRAVREVVVLAADLPDEDMPILHLDYRYRTGEPEIDDVAAEVRTLRARADELSADATRKTSTAAVALVARGLSVRDVAAVLGVSPQRISQLTSRKAG